MRTLQLKRIRPTLIAFLLAFVSAHAAAGLEIERTTNVTDDNGGTLTLISSASRDALGSESTTTATLINFQPAADGRVVDGEVVRDRERSVEQVETVYNGELMIVTPATESGPERLDTLTFQALTVARDGDGPELSGTVIFNGEAVDASTLPKPALRLLARTLRFFKLA